MHRIVVPLLLISVVLIASAAAIGGSSPSRSRTHITVDGSASFAELDARLASDMADGELNDFSLFDAALIASGVQSDGEFVARRDAFQRSCDEFETKVRRLASIQAQLDLVSHYLHHRFLTGEYRYDATELQCTLDTGNFNCVTATILFQSIARECGMEVVAIAADSHVMSGSLASPRFYVETTSPIWKAAAADNCGKVTTERILRGHELTEVQLVTKVLYNRGVAQLEAGQFEGAVKLLSNASKLDAEDNSTRENLLAAYNNWALSECDAGRFSRATELLANGLAIDPCNGPLLTNDLHIHQRWIKELCVAGDFRAAAAILEGCYLRRPSANFFDRGRRAVYSLWAEHDSQRSELNEGGKQQHSDAPPICSKPIYEVGI